MQGSALKLCVATVIIAALAISGCGSSGGGGVLNQIGYEYFISSLAVDDRGDPTTDIDVFHDCNGIWEDGGDGEDLLTKASMDITLESSTDTDLDAWLYKVKIRFDLLNPELYEGDPNVPFLPTKTYDTTALIRAKGGSVTKSFDLLSALDKQNYVDALGGGAAAIDISATFQVTVTAYMTFTPDDPDNDYEAEFSEIINVQNFADASCTEE